MAEVQITMLGELSIRAGGNKISDSDNRSKKVWQLLAVLLCRQNRPVAQKDLIELLYGEDSSSANPENALKITFHRLRGLLDQLWPSAGHELIIRKSGGYVWNSEIPCWMDTEEFERLCHCDAADASERLDAYLMALALYRGDFLPKLSSETWVIPVAAHYHNMYVETVLKAAPLLMEQGSYRAAADICRAATPLEPYHEGLHQKLMEALLAMDDQKGAAAVYEALAGRLYEDFGIKPGKEIHTVYRAATQILSDQSMPMEVVLGHLQEEQSADGALYCDFDYFKVLCHAEARTMQRSGKATHIALFSIVGADTNKPLAKRSMERVMDNLETEIRLNLRRGDIFSRCSVSQFVLMLPNANYENSCMVCRRVVGAFQRRYPHAPAKIHFVVQPLTDSFLA